MCAESDFKLFWPEIWFIILVFLLDFLLYKQVWTEYTGPWCLCGRCRFESGSNMSNLYILSCGAQVEDAGFNLASSANQVPFSLPHNIPSKKNVRGKWHFLFIFVCWCTEYITLLFTSSGSLSLHFPFSFIPSVLSSICFSLLVSSLSNFVLCTVSYPCEVQAPS